MGRLVICDNCRNHVYLNDDKHKTRPKYCPKCKSVVEANNSWLGKLAELINSRWRDIQSKRKQEARERFYERMKKENPLLKPQELASLVQRKSYKRFGEEA